MAALVTANRLKISDLICGSVARHARAHLGRRGKALVDKDAARKVVDPTKGLTVGPVQGVDPQRSTSPPHRCPT